ncbi:MAG: hypothetical protein JSU57_05955 [Candidatus Heimdallarchaeota archaeon]|nr:MAG: hypothetical protein JSU57_05955 [Candidatus Heimdallarchaeota archaeon]
MIVKKLSHHLKKQIFKAIANTSIYYKTSIDNIVFIVGDIMTDIALQGKLVDLREAVVETVEEKWQTESLKKQIEKAGLRKKGFMMPLDAVDVTERDFHLVERFEPEIQLSGIELRSERKSKAWGGSYFRILESREEDDLRCIQWIYIWTKQRFFISLWMTVLPLFVLGLLGTLIYSYLSFTHAILSVLLIGGIFFLLGARALFAALKGLTKGSYFFSNGQLFIIFGVIFWALLGEIYISKGSQTKDFVEGAEAWHPPIPGEEITELILEETLKISWISMIFFVAAIIALVFWKWEPPSFTHATHDMDWAPFFVYLRGRRDEWQLEKVRYDNFHYFAETLSFDQLKKKNAVTKDQKPRFEIPNFWHSFRPNGGFNDWFTVLFGFLILVISILLAVISFRSTPNNSLITHEIVRFVLIPLLLFFGAYLVFSRWPTDVVSKKINLSDPIYHLTDNRLRIFWNLRGEEPALKVRSKLQDPFMDDEDFGTFRDDLEQIVFYNLLPKLRELEQKEFFQRL